MNMRISAFLLNIVVCEFFRNLRERISGLSEGNFQRESHCNGKCHLDQMWSSQKPVPSAREWKASVCPLQGPIQNDSRFVQGPFQNDLWFPLSLKFTE